MRSSHIQYVELSLEGASLRRQTITLPPSLAPLAKNEQIQQRLRTTYQLISDHSKINDKPLHDTLNRIRKEFTHTVKSLGGNVMLRSKQDAMEKQLKTLENDLEVYRAKLEQNLEGEIAKSLDQLTSALLPLVTRQPPPELRNGCLGEKPTRPEAERWLRHELGKSFPRVEALVKQIELKKTYKDVTFDSLNKPSLQAELQEAFPAIEWKKPFTEFAAAKAAE